MSLDPTDDPTREDGPIGGVLAAARTRAGLTPEQLSETTRVRAGVILAIEADDFTLCGGDVYARGHIRTLARTLGVDPAPLVAAYDARPRTVPTVAPVLPADVTAAELSGLSGVTAALRARRMPRMRREVPVGTGADVAPAARPNVYIGIAAALALVLVFLVVKISTAHHGASQDDPKAAAGTAAPPQSGPPTPANVAPPEPPASSGPPTPTGVTVHIEAAARTWVRVVDGSGHRVFQNFLPKGGSQDFTDPASLSLVVGNAGNVHLTVNGKDFGPAGKPGRVARLTLTPDSQPSASPVPSASTDPSTGG